MDEMRYLRPASVEEALRFLKQEQDAVIIAGGIVVNSLINQHLTSPSVLVDIGRIAELKGIRPDRNGGLVIGALVTHDDVLRSTLIRERAPLLSEIAMDISCDRLRNRGTLGGSLCTVGGQGDPATGLIALGAKVRLHSAGSVREMALEEFYTDGFSTAIKPDEILGSVSVPPSRSPSVYGFCKLGPRNAMDWTQITVAVHGGIDAGNVLEDIRIGANGLSPTAVRARAAERALNGQRIDSVNWSRVYEALQSDISPDSDLIYSEAYKRHLGGAALRRAVEKAFRRHRAGSH